MGQDSVRQAHATLSQDEFAYREPYAFHPHITLAQDFPQPESVELTQRAQSLWESWKGDRGFLLDQVSFVQGADLCTWETVSEHELNHSRRLKTA
jgi:2'-5' RNA ligase